MGLLKNSIGSVLVNINSIRNSQDAPQRNIASGGGGIRASGGGGIRASGGGASKSDDNAMDLI